MSRTPSRRDHGRPARALMFSAALVLFTAGHAAAQVPGPEIFGSDLSDPLELWEAADYLVKTDQAAAAVPFLQKFLDAPADDAVLVGIRDRYGFGLPLKLQDNPATQPFAEPLVNRLIEAGRRLDASPERVARLVEGLTKTPTEQALAVQGLRASGALAVPAVLKALVEKAPDDPGRAALERNLPRLGTPAVPPLVAALESPDAAVGVAAADALGRIGDARAVPWLTAAAVAGPGEPPAKAAAVKAVEAITRRPFGAQPKAPSVLLSDEARKYQTGKIKFPGDAVTLWNWDADSNAPAPKVVDKADAGAELGRKLARAALAVDPNDLAATAVDVGLGLDRAIARDGFAAAEPDEDDGASPEVLTEVLRQAIEARNDDLGAAAARALARGLDAEAVASARPFHPLVEALNATGRRTRFAAAKALAGLDPNRPFPGSSGVVPALAHFIAARPAPKAVIIDGNLSRGNNLARNFRALGYDTVAAFTGDEGFQEAAASADVELVTVDRQMMTGDWRLQDTLANLRADARTAGLPLYVVGPLAIEYDLPALQERFPGVRLLVDPVGPGVLDQQLGVVGRPTPLPISEKADYAREASALLSRIAAKPNSPYAPDLLKVEPTVHAALRQASTSTAAADVLAATPALAAQRGLADALTDPTAPQALRVEAASRLAQSVRSFGPLVTGTQEARLVETYNRDGAPAVRAALAEVFAALRPKDPKGPAASR